MAVLGFDLACRRPPFVACPDFERGNQKLKGGRPIWVLARRRCGVASPGSRRVSTALLTDEKPDTGVIQLATRGGTGRSGVLGDLCLYSSLGPRRSGGSVAGPSEPGTRVRADVERGAIPVVDPGDLLWCGSI